MNSEPEKNTVLSGSSIPIAASKMFTYPTRLASAWKPDIMEINLPGYLLERPEVEIIVRQGSTRSIENNSGNIYQKIYRKLTAPMQVDGSYILDSRYETDGNIAHMMTGVVPQLLAAKKLVGDKITVVVRSNATSMAKNIYNLLGTSLLCTDKDIDGKLILASQNFMYSYDGWYTTLCADLDFEGLNQHTPEKIFISRKGARSLINESEVEQILQTYGFKKYYFEDIPISEQWSVARNAKIVVGVHGAAMAHLILNRHKVKLIELFHPGYVVDMYRNIAGAVGGSWCAVTGQITQDVIAELDFKEQARKFAATPTRIDINSLQMALEYLEISAK
ncbi:glycosyltransferase family 61 protein [Microcoleus sp. herbarium14]|uniref:glycosyltransferase family 61 protein n=1 Tax=Microcoleus sp. herbarium14 TaxID=3055439 RepID=UPI002FD449BD